MNDGPRGARPPGLFARSAGFFRGLIGLVRLALFALVFAGLLNASSHTFKAASVARSTGAPEGSARLAMGLIAAATLAMLVLTVMVGYPLSRRLPMRTALSLAAPTVLVGAAGLAVAYAAGSHLGAVALGTLLLPLVAFAFSLLLAWGAPPIPQRVRRSAGGRPGAPMGPPASPPQRQRQRRGGRKR